ncbi:MAG: hypothetical protein Q8Q14_11700 [Gemmatimonadales bacterium]|nr:hypothetical protein [Gemmatimonadales bacterium]
MTLPRLVLAWLPVAMLFALAPPLGYGWAPDGAEPPAPPRALVWRPNRWEVGWRLAEAVVLTLFAALWFDSLGAGGWGLLFFLVGLLIAFPRRLVMWQYVDPLRQHHLLLHAALDVARYLAAGAALAWRLS